MNPEMNGGGKAHPGQAGRVSDSGDYTWAYILAECEDGISCPAEIPEGAYVAN